LKNIAGVIGKDKPWCLPFENHKQLYI